MTESVSHVVVLTLLLHLPRPQSLKEKRMVLRSLKDRLRTRFNVSIAELGEMDKWQKSELGVCAIGNDRSYLEGTAESVARFVSEERSVAVIDHEIFFV